MIGADGITGRLHQGVAIVDHKIRRLQADINQHHAAVPFLGKYGCIGRGHRFKHGLFHAEVRFVNGANQAVMIGGGRSNNVDIGFEARAACAFRIVKSSPAVDGEVLRKYLQQYAVVLKADTAGPFNRIPHVLFHDFTRVSEFVDAASVASRDCRAA